MEVSQEIRKLGLRCDPILKSYHLTLAYQFQQAHFSGTESQLIGGLQKLRNSIYSIILARLTNF